MSLAQLIDPKSNKVLKAYDHDRNHAWYLVGDIYFRTSRFKKAASFFRLALAEWPQDVDALWALGNCHTELKNYKKSEMYFRKAIALAPRNSKIIYNLANSLFDQGRYDEAVKIFDRVSASDPETHRRAKKNRRIAFQKANKTRTAKKTRPQ